jgi:hypothetical protein
MFSGSYLPEDVTFLLKRVTLAPTPVEEKEHLIQSGRKHYSEMISAEHLPSPLYLRVFHQALDRQKTRFARHLLILAALLCRVRSGPITLVSLARAGTPIGILLARILRQRFAHAVSHYSISIIRERGIDTVALRYILSRHEAESLIFVDGWTGKGVIAGELLRSIQRFNEQEKQSLEPGLYVVADLCGESAGAATAEDYLIPSSVLGCTISGLVSRSILNEDVIGPGDFHGCVFHDEFQSQDLSRWFIDTIMNEVATIDYSGSNSGITTEQRNQLRQRNAGFLQDVGTRFGVRDVNHIKPGIGEATRVLLRRLPDRLLLRDADHPDVEHLRVLAVEKGVLIEVDPQLPYQAAALIREVAP